MSSFVSLEEKWIPFIRTKLISEYELLLDQELVNQEYETEESEIPTVEEPETEPIQEPEPDFEQVDDNEFGEACRI